MIASTRNFSIYLPAIPDKTPEYHIIKSLKDMGKINNVDAVETYNQINKKDCFVHFDFLFDTKQNHSMLKLLNRGKCVQYTYCKKPLKFWNIFKNTSKRYVNSHLLNVVQEKQKEKQDTKVVVLRKEDHSHMRSNSYFAALMKQNKSSTQLNKKDHCNTSEFEKGLQKDNTTEDDIEEFLNEIDAMDETIHH